jgi:hypothetical protein
VFETNMAFDISIALTVWSTCKRFCITQGRNHRFNIYARLVPRIIQSCFSLKTCHISSLIIMLLPVHTWLCESIDFFSTGWISRRSPPYGVFTGLSVPVYRNISYIHPPKVHPMNGATIGICDRVISPSYQSSYSVGQSIPRSNSFPPSKPRGRIRSYRRPIWAQSLGRG